MKFLFRTPGIPLVLIPSLVLSPIWAQTPMAVPEQITRAANLELRVVQNDSPLNSSASRELAVQVRDGNGGPVADAAVAFRLPDSALSGNFADGSRSAVAYTDASGVAHVDGIHWVADSGTVPVRITATKGNSHAGLLFDQKLSNTPAEPTSLSHEVEATLKPATALSAPLPIAPGAVAPEAAQAPAAAIVSAAIPSEVAVPETGPRPSVSISNLSRSKAIGANALRPATDPSVSISSSPGGYSNHSSLKKWLIWTAVIAGGAGAGFAFSGRTSSTSATTTSTSTTIGTPTINISH